MSQEHAYLLLARLMMMAKEFFSRFLNPVVPVVLALIGSLVFIDAYGPADVVNYHLPFSIRFLGLKNFPDFSGTSDDLYSGFPVLWRLALGPGLALDRPRLFLLPNFVGLGLFAFLCRRYLRLPLLITVASCLVFQLLCMNFVRLCRTSS